MTSEQAAVLRTLADKLRPHHLLKNGVATRKSEAEYIIATLKAAAEGRDASH